MRAVDTLAPHVGPLLTSAGVTVEGSDQLGAASAQYFGYKQALKEWLAMPDTELHIHAGLIVFALMTVLLCRRRLNLWPVVAVIGFAIANETIDFFRPGKDGHFSFSDVAYTVFWPIVLYFVMRATRR